MNIEDIKRQINNKNLNLQGKGPQQQYNLPEYQPQQQPQPQPQQDNFILFNNLLNPQEEEEEQIPESEIWSSEQELNINKPISSIINKLELESEVFDWRTTTRKGRQSRKNFTAYLREML